MPRTVSMSFEESYSWDFDYESMNHFVVRQKQSFGDFQLIENFDQWSQTQVRKLSQHEDIQKYLDSPIDQESSKEKQTLSNHGNEQNAQVISLERDTTSQHVPMSQSIKRPIKGNYDNEISFKNYLQNVNTPMLDTLKEHNLLTPELQHFIRQKKQNNKNGKLVPSQEYFLVVFKILPREQMIDFFEQKHLRRSLTQKRRCFQFPQLKIILDLNLPVVEDASKSGELNKTKLLANEDIRRVIYIYRVEYDNVDLYN